MHHYLAFGIEFILSQLGLLRGGVVSYLSQATTGKLDPDSPLLIEGGTGDQGYYQISHVHFHSPLHPVRCTMVAIRAILST
jgi:hypothetical protein